MNGAAGGRAGEAKFTFSERGRGRIQRLDVTVSEAFLGSDGDGLPDWFEDQFAALGFDKNNPLDAAADFNGNGLSNLAEYTQGSDPAALAETYAAWAARRGLTAQRRYARPTPMRTARITLRSSPWTAIRCWPIAKCCSPALAARSSGWASPTG